MHACRPDAALDRQQLCSRCAATCPCQAGGAGARQSCTWPLTASLAQIWQYLAAGQGSDARLGHWWPQGSSCVQRAELGRCTQGALHGRKQPGATHGSRQGVQACGSRIRCQQDPTMLPLPQRPPCRRMLSCSTARCQGGNLQAACALTLLQASTQLPCTQRTGHCLLQPEHGCSEPWQRLVHWCPQSRGLVQASLHSTCSTSGLPAVHASDLAGDHATRTVTVLEEQRHRTTSCMPGCLLARQKCAHQHVPCPGRRARPACCAACAAWWHWPQVALQGWPQPVTTCLHGCVHLPGLARYCKQPASGTRGAGPAHNQPEACSAVSLQHPSGLQQASWAANGLWALCSAGHSADTVQLAALVDATAAPPTAGCRAPTACADRLA